MMNVLSLFSEPYAATGNMGDGGFKRLLGAPSLDGLQLVLREAIQNSCDAAKLGSGPRILIRVRTLTPTQLAIARDILLAQRPFIASSAQVIDAFLASDSPRVLEISDFGTTGLGGPTRADRIPPGADRTDFIDFFRNVGTRRNTELGGGTYGFGKASLYRVSRCSTIIVDTLAHDTSTGAEERRLMGCHLGEAGEREEGDGYLRRYTGRHWWGVAASDGGATEPVTGDDAVALGEALGMPSRNNAGDSGTSILILDPDFRQDVSEQEPAEADAGGSEPEDIGIHIVERVLWNLWPRMLESTPEARRIRLTVEVEGAEIPLPRPEDCPPLDLFARALNIIRAGEAREIRCERPAQGLGRLAISRGLRADRIPAFRGRATLFPDRAAHIALMRPAEMVVTYMQGTPLPDERTEWAGVFTTTDQTNVEEAFAGSEPAAHDAWDPSALPRGNQRTFVTVAMRRLREAAAAVAAPAVASGARDGPTQTVATVAGRLGAFLAGVGPGGPSRRGGVGSGGGSSNRRRVGQPVFERLEWSGGERTALFRLTVSGQGHLSHLELTPTISLDGGGVSAVGLDVAKPPRIVEVLDASGEALVLSAPIFIGKFEGELRIRMTVPDDCAVGLKAILLSGSAA
jgi:hypothetical protein